MPITATYDVAVVGLGVMGAMTLWQLARRGVSVVGVEQFDIGHARGSSHGGSRIFRRVVPEGAGYVELVHRADALWDQLQHDSQVRIRTTTGGLTIGTDGEPFVTNALRAARAGDVAVEEVTAHEIRRRFGQHTVFDDDVAVFEPGAGVLYPENAIRAAIQLATRHGAALHTGERVTDLSHGDDGVTISTEHRRLAARCAVVATGAWLDGLVPDLGLPVRVQRSVPFWYGPAPIGFGADDFPVFTRRSHHLNGWGIPDVDGHGVKIGVGGAPKPWLRFPEDNWTTSNEDDLDLVERFRHEAFPGLAGTTPHAYACMNSKTPDNDFIIDTAPGIVVVGGFSGHGFKYASAVGDVAAHLAVGRPSPLPIERFSIDRFATTTWRTPHAPMF